MEVYLFPFTSATKLHFFLGVFLHFITGDDNGKQEPRVLGRTLNFTRSKNGGLRKFVQSWLGKTFTDDEFNELDTNDLVGTPAQLSVVLNESGDYANIDTIMQLPRGMAAPAPVSALVRYDMEPWDDVAFAALPDWAQEQVKKSTQYQKFHVPTAPVDVDTSGGRGTAPEQKEENPI